MNFYLYLYLLFHMTNYSKTQWHIVINIYFLFVCQKIAWGSTDLGCTWLGLALSNELF